MKMPTATITATTAAKKEETKVQDNKLDSKQGVDITSTSQHGEPEIEEEQPDEKKPIIDTTISIEAQQLGIWKLQIGVPQTKPYLQYLDEAKSSYPLLRRLATDIYLIAPRLFVTFVLCQMWQGVEDALMMQLSSSLLRTVEMGLITGHPNTRQILLAIAARLLCSLLVAYLSWRGEETLMALHSRVTGHFDMFLMKAKLQVDLPTSHEANSQPEGSADDIWSAFEEIICFLTEILTTLTHLAFIAHLSKETGGPVFAFLCVSQPLFSAAFSKALWNKVCFGYVNNEHYKRMEALEDLAGGEYRQDLISGNLSEWILKEYQKSYNSLGEVHSDDASEQYGHRESPLFGMVSKVLGDSPMIYCALCAIFSPSKFSIASIAILQRSSTTLRYSLEEILRSSKQFRRSMTSVKNAYASSAVVNTLSDGQTPYPPPATEKGDATVHKGMSFDLKAVSFSYPGSQKSTPALDRISLSIPAGQLVVIVGSNGSGKSTLVRILSRLYDPSSGRVYIDHRPSCDYRMHDLHQATSILSQDNLIYPLSFAENIGLGFPEQSTDAEMIKEAAREGGAEGFMGKLQNGVDTTLDPILNTFSYNLYGNKTHPLYEEMEKIEKTIDISDGEEQRICASRCFMRFKSGKIKFVAVDEPSSALDAEGELQLFERLIALREGKTMVFVTHRFGHLTKHADQIICMKDGSIAEVGSHDELLGKKGEYAKLYGIQASAFIPDSPSL